MFGIYYKDGRPGITYNGKPYFRPVGNVRLQDVERFVEMCNKFSMINEPIFQDCKSQEEIDDLIKDVMPLNTLSGIAVPVGRSIATARAEGWVENVRLSAPGMTLQKSQRD